MDHSIRIVQSKASKTITSDVNIHIVDHRFDIQDLEEALDKFIKDFLDGQAQPKTS
jgi:hypothetical protein